MNTRTFFSALSIVATLFSFASCVKEEAVSAPTTVDKGPSIPEGSRIRIHFGTATQEGCLYSFSDCIWIGWGTTATNFDGRLAIEFDNGDAAGQYFGQYFPLTSDYVVDDVEAHALGIEPQIIPAGFYAVRNHSSGQATGKRMVIFDPTQGESAGNLLNPNNPQDNIGQLHNLAVQVILNDNRDAINALNGDKAAIQQLFSRNDLFLDAEQMMEIGESLVKAAK